ncbi:MAG: hypothetical protein L6V93_17750 [Clostridiales bacterium]|nr:MAG: hypothetical protein L6V93_17750 [Clostridiales bacterium]
MSGGIYVDNARLKFTDYISDAYKINVTANDKFSWYTLGENVIYTTDAGLSGTDKNRGSYLFRRCGNFQKNRVGIHVFQTADLFIRPTNRDITRCSFSPCAVTAQRCRL